MEIVQETVTVKRALVVKMMRPAALVALVLALCMGQTTAADDQAFHWASAAFGAGVFADAWTSERGFDSGFTESNPTLPQRPTDSRFIAQVAITDGALYLFARHLRHRHPALARWVLIGGGIVHATAAARNDRLYDEWK